MGSRSHRRHRERTEKLEPTPDERESSYHNDNIDFAVQLSRAESTREPERVPPPIPKPKAKLPPAKAPAAALHLVVDHPIRVELLPDGQVSVLMDSDQSTFPDWKSAAVWLLCLVDPDNPNAAALAWELRHQQLWSLSKADLRDWLMSRS
jgi:hypothetical protein